MSPAKKESATAIREAALRIATAHTHGLSQVRLLKLLWLAELRYFEAYGERLTPAGWWRWDFGPYSKDVINTVRKDARHFELSHDDEAHTAGGLAISAKAPAGNSTLSQRALNLIDDVVDLYSSYSTAELLAEVYADPFFEQTSYGDDFNFADLLSLRKVVPEAKARRLLELQTRPVESIEGLFG
jgi:uncharacterized phage-associated protein